MMRRHPILVLTAALLFTLTGLAAWFAATFDADHYRLRLQTELSAALGHPVQMENAALTLRRGPAVALSGLRIDAEEAGFALQAERLYLRLEWAPLLRGEIAFSRILLTNPRLHLILLPEKPPADQPSSLRPRFDLVKSAAITSLAVQGGHLSLEDRRDAGRPSIVEIDGIDGEITDFAADHSAWVRFTGRLPQGGNDSTVMLAGEITPPPSIASWRRTRVAIGALVERFQPQPFLEAFTGIPADTISGEGRVELTLDGAPAEGLRGTLRVIGADLALRPPQGYAQPIPLPSLEVSAVWVADSTAHRLRDLSLKIDELVLEGEGAWHHQEGEPLVEARLRGSPLPSSSLWRYLPDETVSLREHLSGTLQISSLEVAAPADLLRDPAAILPLLRAEGTLSQGHFSLPPFGPADEVYAVLLLADNVLTISDGRGTALGAPLQFSVEIDDLFSGDPSFQIKAQGAIPADRLSSLLPQETAKRLVMSGQVPLVLGMAGKRDDLRLDLDADLKGLAARWEEGFVKRRGQAGSLTLAAGISEGRVTLDFARLDLPGAALRANGSWLHAAPHDLHLHLDLAVPDLQAARPLFPPLGKIQARGALAVRGDIVRSDSAWRREGTLFLREAGLRPGVVADINQMTGSIRLTEGGAQIERLTARLGTSPVAVDGGLENFSDPRLQLRVRGTAIRADEIIFPSPRAILRDIDAHLTIERDRVAFSPVSVRLDGGTTATVTGEVRDFANPVVELDVRAPYGDINEVIALWGAREAAPAAEKKRDHRTRVRISAGVGTGKIGNLNFEDAEGIISWERGLLTIHPLHFRAARGFCSGRVLVESRPEGHHLIVSGHLEDAEAAHLQQDLLNDKRLINGKLTGDFFVEGVIGPDFRRTSRGSIHLELEKGVLRRFNSLSKIFSILNISQIFSLQLPDMSREGMPFNHLRATFTLDQGNLQTEDLLIDSHAMNMSLIGSVDLVSERVDAVMAVKPLRTVDKIVTRIPLAGWILTGEEKALVTAHFHIRGPLDATEVIPIPINSVSEKAVGIFRRILGLPGRLVGNLEEFVRPEDL